MKQLTTRTTQPGDLMLKINTGSFSGKLIKLGQTLAGQKNADVVHAGILFDNNFIIEAQGGGLMAHDVRVQNKDIGYLVFRPNSVNLARGAANCAKLMFDIQSTHKTLKYAYAGAAGSLMGGKGHAMKGGDMDQLLDDILSGKGHPFFCSHFVVYVYQFVAEQNKIPAKSIFPMNAAKVSPSTLASNLKTNSFFQEAGYLMPNER
jgi:hypothetical protein